MRPTGKIRYRVGWFGRLILQIEECNKLKSDEYPPTYYRWRDAKTSDLTPQILETERLE